jgi:hypothetical protein
MQQDPRPGWYPDPEYPAYQRYWDGRQWTDDRAPMAPPAAAGQPPSVEALIGPETANAIAKASNVANVLGFVGFLILVAVFVLIVFATRN